MIPGIERPPYVSERSWTRFWAKVTENDSGCWLWTASLKPGGYGQVVIKYEHFYVHRLVYEWCGNIISAGHDVHHTCGVRHCVNPTHLELVARTIHRTMPRIPATHCRRGHKYTEDNIKISSSGRRWCGRCYETWLEKTREQRNAAQAARSKRYYWENRDKVRAYKARWYRQHKTVLDADPYSVV